MAAACGGAREAVGVTVIIGVTTVASTVAALLGASGRLDVGVELLFLLPLPTLSPTVGRSGRGVMSASDLVTRHLPLKRVRGPVHGQGPRRGLSRDNAR